MSAEWTPSTRKKARSSEAMTKRMMSRTGRRVVLGAAIFAALAGLTAATSRWRKTRTACGCARRYPTPRATTRAGNTRRPPSISAPRSTARPPTPTRSAATTGSSCSSARRRPNAARSTRRSDACAPISTNCSPAPARASNRRDLIARYDAQCLDAAPAQPPNIFASLFGGGQPGQATSRSCR